MMRRFRNYMMFVALLALQMANGQTVIYPLSTAPVCQEIIVGETILFAANQMGTATQPVCDVTASVGVGIISLNADIDTVLTVAEIPSYTFNYTFDKAGEYFIFCGSPTTMSSSSASGNRSNICYNVLQAKAIPSIPTLSEWGMIILSLLLAIIGFIVLQRSFFKKEEVNIS